TTPFLFTDTPTTEIYTLSLHDALPIYAHPDQRAARAEEQEARPGGAEHAGERRRDGADARQEFAEHQRPAAPTLVMQRGLPHARSEEHTSELQSRRDLVCRLLLEKKKQ